MAVFVLSCVLVLVVGGCVCVVWAARGGPRWVRVVAAVTVGLGQLVSMAGGGRRSRSSRGGTADDSDG
ncbi:hypothetical protein ABT142_17030 [Streptomyces sp. NPDC001857]|uniref:hypothetical protein n=1 Tax=unclassified Streptomyces TaxID=2593676 RepID=UPI00332788A3